MFAGNYSTYADYVNKHKEFFPEVFEEDEEEDDEDEDSEE